MNAARLLDRWTRSAVLPAVRLILWLYLYLSLLLGGWIFLGLTLGGWSPVVVTSGSMEPTLSVGDVLMIDTDPGDTVAQRAVVVFERSGGEVIAHRVFSVEPTGLVTKGDANAAPDIERVDPSKIIGAGRLVVPVIGMPAVWAAQGNRIALTAWVVMTLAGLAHLGALANRRIRDNDKRQTVAATDMPIAQLGIRRVRALVAVLITAQFLLDPSRFEVFNDALDRRWVLVASLAVLAGTNVASSRIAARSVGMTALPIMELTVDTVLVVLLNTFTGASGIGWVLFALPIIEAAVRFRLVGALAHWTALTIVTVAARIWTSHLGTTAGLLGELESVLDQLSVLFLVVVPGAYLVEQLIGDVASQQRATGRALERGTLLEHVAETGREVSRLGGEHIVALVEGTVRLGFDVVDVLVGTEGGWQQLAADDNGGPLPAAGRYGSGLRPEDLIHPGVIVDHRDPDPVEVAALQRAGLEAVVVQTVSQGDGRRLVLRAGVRSGASATPAMVDAFRLLAGQASVALHNDQLLDEVTSMHEELEFQAHHDALTRLPNRVRLLAEIRNALAGPTQRPALLFLDLDRFKPVNDRLGHEAGDALLKMVAQRLGNVAPPGAVVARVGGDEFTMLIPGSVTDDEAVVVARAVWEHLRETFEVGGDLVNISTSVGVAFGEPGIGETELIRRADVAMYVAKHGAKHGAENSFCELYREGLDQAETRRAKLMAGITQALHRRELELAYQPIFSVGGRPSVVGFEALLRWEHADFGSVPPNEIIEAARVSRVRDELNRWIAHQACTDAAIWATQVPDLAFFMSVNASPEELASRTLVSNINAALLSSGFPADRLFVEISERLVAPDAPGVVANMDALHSIGVRLLLDDFGEGQTSLSYLHELPVAGIKLDRRLVVNLLRSETDRIVLGSVVDLCHRLDLVVIAEGIETSEHLSAVDAAGCNLAQGYHLGRPQSAAAISRSLTAVPAATIGRG